MKQTNDGIFELYVFYIELQICSFFKLTIYFNFATMYQIQNFLANNKRNKCLPLPGFLDHVTWSTAFFC